VTRPIRPPRKRLGRDAKHGGRQLERVSRRNLWDRRTTTWQLRCEIATEIANDLFGGWEKVDAGIDRLIVGYADLSIICDSIMGHVAKQSGPVTASGELLPVLRRGFPVMGDLLAFSPNASRPRQMSRTGSWEYVRQSNSCPDLF
jgi:hypothetical protein